MPFMAAAPLLWGGIAAGAGTAAGAIVGASKTAGAAKRGAQLQTEAANKAAELEKQSRDDTLAWQKQQAIYDATVAESTRRANYDQANAENTRRGSLGELVGLPARTYPSYVPLPPNTSLGTPPPGGPPPGTPGTPPPTAPPSGASAALPVSAEKGDIAPQVAAYFKARGVAPQPTSVQYWTQKWQEFGQRDPVYFNQRLAQADEFGGGGAPLNRAPAAGVQPGPISSQDWFTRQPLTRPLPGSVGSYF